MVDRSRRDVDRLRPNTTRRTEGEEPPQASPCDTVTSQGGVVFRQVVLEVFGSGTWSRPLQVLLNRSSVQDRDHMGWTGGQTRSTTRDHVPGLDWGSEQVQD
ncbi:unnamed protein product [Boreogadus saida]